MIMEKFVLTRKQFIPAPIEEVWLFFSSPHNLEKITPEALGLVITKCLEVKGIFPGMEISYTVRPLLSVPLKWTTEITDVEAPFAFTDVQRRGPYKLWKHEHRFAPAGNGVWMEDVVTYHPGGGLLARWIDKLLVAGRLKAIFDYREEKVKEIFK